MKDSKKINRRNTRRATQIIHYVHTDDNITNDSNADHNINISENNENKTLINTDNSPLTQPSSFQTSLNFFRELEEKSLMEKSINAKQGRKSEKLISGKEIQKDCNTIIRRDNDLNNVENNKLPISNNYSSNHQNLNQSHKNYMKYYIKKIFEVEKEVSHNFYIDQIENKDPDLHKNNGINSLNNEEIKNTLIGSPNIEPDKINTNESALEGSKLFIPDRLFDYKKIKSQFK